MYERVSDCCSRRDYCKASFLQLLDCVFVILCLKSLVYFFRNGRVIRIGRIENFLLLKHMVKASQHHACNGDDCPFVITAFIDTVIFVLKPRCGNKKEAQPLSFRFVPERSERNVS